MLSLKATGRLIATMMLLSIGFVFCLKALHMPQSIVQS